MTHYDSVYEHPKFVNPETYDPMSGVIRFVVVTQPYLEQLFEYIDQLDVDEFTVYHVEEVVRKDQDCVRFTIATR